jgi:uncharacterized protein
MAGEFGEGAVNEMLNVFAIYSGGTYVETISPRLSDYAGVMFSWLFIFPQAVFLFLVGAIVAQLGWLKYPTRHRAKLWRILWVSIAVGVPIAIVFANHGLSWSTDPARLPDIFDSLAMGFSPLLTPAYIAGFALFGTSTFGQKLINLLAPMGRLALSNYLLQSVLMTLFLAGVGFGLADRGQFQIALIAIGIYLAQLIASHIYLRHYTQGPMEALWRRYTYGRQE